MFTFGTVIRKDDEGQYWAEVPDLVGCFGQGDTFNEAIESISDGLETHIASMLECGMDVPEPTKVTSNDGEVVYVAVTPNEYTLKEPSVTASEASRILNVTPSRVSQLITAGKLKAKRNVGETLVTVDSIDEYASSARVAGRPALTTV